MVLLPALAGEGHAEELQKFPGLLVGLRRRHDADLQPAETVDLVVIDLGERELLAHPEAVVAAPVERLGRDAPEVADARERQDSEALHEVPHPLAAEGHLGADGVARPETELGDGALCLRDNRLLARDEGQKPIVTKAKRSIAQFRLRTGNTIGAKVTLRGERMWDFMERLTVLALPRIRDFRGIPAKSFDGRGNYSLGMREQLAFPEIDYDKVDRLRGLEISIVTTAKTDEESRKLLELLGMPFAG